MPLSVGIVGFPNVGKSTLFRTITKKTVACDNYPFCTIDPNVGIVSVFDRRVDLIFEKSKSEKKTYSTIEFIDIAGLVKGASKGEGLGNKFLAHIRETDMIIYVLRAFQDGKIINTLPETDPLKEIELLDTELILKDLETIEKRIELLQKESKNLNKDIIFELETLEKSQKLLEEERFLLEQNLDEKEKKILDSYRFLTMKPKIFILNGKEKDISEKMFEKLRRKNFIIIDLAEEYQLSDLNREERFSLGLPEEEKINNLVKECYDLLGYITFFTVNSEETRAWKIKKGAKAPEAGGIVHTDFEKGFIKAEVINWKDFIEMGGFSEARKNGLVRTEGKEYIVRDGDIVEIKFR